MSPNDSLRLNVTISNNGPILLVDDEAGEFQIAKHYYDKSVLENKFIHIQDGASLLEFFEDVNKGSRLPPSMVFMDIQMPGFDGFETLRALNKLEFKFKIPPIVMLSGSHLDGDRDMAMKMGADDYFVKPINGSEFVNMFNSLSKPVN